MAVRDWEKARKESSPIGSRGRWSGLLQPFSGNPRKHRGEGAGRPRRGKKNSVERLLCTTLLFFSFCLHDEAGGRYNYLCLPQEETEARRSYVTC